MCNVYFLFLLAIALFVLRFIASDYPLYVIHFIYSLCHYELSWERTPISLSNTLITSIMFLWDLIQTPYVSMDCDFMLAWIVISRKILLYIIMKCTAKAL
jgi:hypothetical protein